MHSLQNDIISAQERIKPFIRKTPFDYARVLSKALNCHLYLKCEYLQHTGSFKLRGALNKILTLTEEEQKQGIVTASSGNHGTAVAYALNKLNLTGIVFTPENASETKIDNIRSYNIPVQFYGTDTMHTELHAIEYAKLHGMTYISPYNDYQVIAGQGTIAIELLQELNSIDAVLVPVGGGGLISGIAAYLKTQLPHCKIIGCLPSNSPVMAESIKAGKIITMASDETLSDATAGGIEPDAVTFELCQQWVDEFILVSEQEIKDAMLAFFKTQHQLIEGASGVALAAALKNKAQFAKQNIITVLSGANISITDLKKIVC